ncbi:hypothetical protein KIN20_037507 [Parelaphostrongylus tenuis]|uniref:Uncharacterized protein n=1 Tax=Parelaphostrongylus tenuis TaxID=148309 RepID=A0AAD5REN4_PARTN|nr:hypothetical protein KIN20_037507 [Parelaphostrongylus tenuis]
MTLQCAASLFTSSSVFFNLQRYHLLLEVSRRRRPLPRRDALDHSVKSWQTEKTIVTESPRIDIITNKRLSVLFAQASVDAQNH